jgi:NADPH:quinone reductase
MRAARCHAYGPPEALVVEDIPEPELRAGEALVEVHAAAVNYPDVLVLRNAYQISVTPPFIPGSEFAGVVKAVSDGVSAVAAGDRVMGQALVGAFAESISVPTQTLTRIPEGVEFNAAAAVGVGHSTAYYALRSVAELSTGEWVVVLGAAGGVGLATVELAHVLGGRVVAAASSDDKLGACREKGAEATINYASENLKERIRELTGGGADVVIDPVGGPHTEQALRATRWGGRYVCVGFASGEIPRIPLNLVLLKGVVIKGFEIGSFMTRAPDAARRGKDELMGLLASGRVRPHISSVYPLDKTAEALREVAERRAIGKVVIDMR